MKKRLMSLLLVFCMIFSQTAMVQASEAGTGTEADTVTGTDTVTLDVTDTEKHVYIYPDGYIQAENENFKNDEELKAELFVPYVGSYILTGTTDREVNFYSSTEGEAVYDVTFKDLTVKSGRWSTAVKLNNQEGEITLNLSTEGNNLIKSGNHATIKLANTGTGYYAGTINLTMKEQSTLELTSHETQPSVSSQITVNILDDSTCWFDQSKSVSLPLSHGTLTTLPCDDGVYHETTCANANCSLRKQEEHIWVPNNDTTVGGYVCEPCGATNALDSVDLLMIYMTDTAGNGWGLGNSLDIYKNGQLIKNASMESGSEKAVYVSYDTAAYYELVWNTGTDAEECGLLVKLPEEENPLFEQTSFADVLDGATICSINGEPADYTAVDEALANVPSDLQLYTAETVKAVTEAIAAVERHCGSSQQDQVAAMAEAINTAVNSLEYKPADYTAVDEALEAVPEDMSHYTEETRNAVNAAVEAVVRGYNITQQAEVTAMAEAIRTAVANLEWIDGWVTLDLTGINEQLEIYPDKYVLGSSETAHTGGYILTGTMTKEIGIHSEEGKESVYKVLFKDFIQEVSYEYASAITLDNTNGPISLILSTEGQNRIKSGYNHPAIYLSKTGTDAYSAAIELTMEDNSSLSMKSLTSSRGAVSSQINVTIKNELGCGSFDKTKSSAFSKNHGFILTLCEDTAYHAMICSVCGEEKENTKEEHSWKEISSKAIVDETSEEVLGSDITYSCAVCNIVKTEYIGENALFIEMSDSFGDTWNGASLDIYKDGQKYGNLTMSYAKKESTAIAYDESAYYEFVWNKGRYEGRYDDECGLIVTRLSTRETLISKDSFSSVADGEMVLKIGTGADYSAVEAALARVPEDMSAYTEETANALIEAVNGVVRRYGSTQQEEVNAMAVAINQAVDALVSKYYEVSFYTGDGFSNQLVSNESYRHGDSLTAPASKEYQYYIFKGWDLDGDGAVDVTEGEEISNITEDRAYVAVYEVDPSCWYTVAFTEGSQGEIASASSKPDENGAYLVDTWMKVSAPEELEGETDGAVMKFAGWYKGNELVSVNASYSFYLKGDVELTAKYEEEALEPIPAVTFSTLTRIDGYVEEPKKDRACFGITWDAPSGCTVLKEGILRVYAGRGTEEDLTLESANDQVKNQVCSKVGRTGSYTVNCTIGNSLENVDLYVRGYITYRAADGTVKTVYTNVETLSANGI